MHATNNERGEEKKRNFANEYDFSMNGARVTLRTFDLRNCF